MKQVSTKLGHHMQVKKSRESVSQVSQTASIMTEGGNPRMIGALTKRDMGGCQEIVLSPSKVCSAEKVAVASLSYNCFVATRKAEAPIAAAQYGAPWVELLQKSCDGV